MTTEEFLALKKKDVVYCYGKEFVVTDFQCISSLIEPVLTNELDEKWTSAIFAAHLISFSKPNQFKSLKNLPPPKDRAYLE